MCRDMCMCDGCRCGVCGVCVGVEVGRFVRVIVGLVFDEREGV